MRWRDVARVVTTIGITIPGRNGDHYTFIQQRIHLVIYRSAFIASINPKTEVHHCCSAAYMMTPDPLKSSDNV